MLKTEGEWKEHTLWVSVEGVRAGKCRLITSAIYDWSGQGNSQKIGGTYILVRSLSPVHYPPLSRRSGSHQSIHMRTRNIAYVHPVWEIHLGKRRGIRRSVVDQFLTEAER